MKTILIFEPLAGGHRENFIRWLVDASSGYSGCRFVFFTAEDIPEPVARQLLSAGLWGKQRLLYQLFRQACEKHQPDHVLILELTHLELPLVLFGSPVPFSAILFVQYPELPRGLKFFSKHWKTRLLLRRAPVRNLFLLNGEKSCRFLTGKFGARTRFVPVSDPAPEGTADSGFSFNRVGKRICLFFGAISRRKGADILLNVLGQISPETARQNAFFFCGEPEPLYRAQFNQACNKLCSSRPDIDLVIEDRFVSDNQMIAMFQQADLILMPYTRPEYSSGILALAAKTRTPVLGPQDGLLGRLIVENGLGLAAELTPEVLALPVSLNDELCQKFVARNTIGNFTKPILDAVCHES